MLQIQQDEKKKKKARFSKRAHEIPPGNIEEFLHIFCINLPLHTLNHPEDFWQDVSDKL